MAQTATAPINPITGHEYRGSYNPGHQNGSSFYRWAGSTLIVEPRSHTNRDERYRIEVSTRTGSMTCSCDAFKFADKANGQVICKHIAAEAAWIAAELRERADEGKTVRVQAPATPWTPDYRSEDPF